MDREDILRGVYNDFFGQNLIDSENKNSEFSINESNKNESLPDIDDLFIEDNSKELLKSIISYMNLYKEKKEKQYISFNMCIYSNNNETIHDILSIIHTNTNISYLPKGEVKQISFYDIENADKLSEIYNGKSNIVVFKDFKAFSMKEQMIKEKMLHKLNEYILDGSNKILTILIANSKEEINDFYLMSERLKKEFSDFEIIGKNPDIQELYQQVLEKLEKNINIDDDMKIELLDYITNTYKNNNFPYPDYRDDLCEKIIFSKKVPSYEKDKNMEEIFEELDSLVGLDNVKQVLRELVSLIELKNKAKDDLKIKNINLHMIFLGNPGTGKTTVARIVAQILYNLKYIKQNKLIEVSSKDLVAEYVGQTAPKTMAVVQKALGGVLFIDEAYSLASGKGQGNSYNEEAIATLIQAMENNREDLVVIFAGYTKEMQDFLNSNSGIVSRIGYTIEFKDYTSDELVQIFLQMMKKAGFIVTEDAIERAKEIIEQYKNRENFGNARFARNLYEKSVVKHAANTSGKKGKKLIKTISVDDISAENLIG